ncbi:MAG: MucB/RseB C-terminal domain-containing protein [Nevskia sp.]|nr:MucB/RseB C-terminal domain-containing protein [Nevskia sp.]
MHALLYRATAACSAAVLSAYAADPSETLIRAADADRTTTYEGVVLYRGDEQYDVLKVQHRFSDGIEREHIVSLTGEPRQLLRIDHRLICILPKDRMVSIDRPAGMKNFLSQLKAERLHELAQWYEFRDQGSGRIAGRDCNGVVVMPRDQYRYGYEMWADKITGMPLKLTLVGQQGEVLEQVMFTEVSFPASIEDAAFLEPPVDASKFKLIASDLPSLDAAPANDDRPQVTFEKLPPGYRVVAREQRPLPGSPNGQVEHLLLSDGLSAVSVFSAVEQHAPEKSFRGVSHMGPVEAYGRMVGSYHITIMGEVPPQAVRMIGDGVRPVFDFESPPPAPAHNP